MLHLTPYAPPAYAFGGVTRVIDGLARAQVRRGHRVTVLTTDAHTRDTRSAAPSDETTAEGVRVVRVPNASVWLRGHLNLSTPLHIRRAAARLWGDVDIIHAHEFRTVENLLALRGTHPPVVMSPHGTLTATTGRSAVKAAWDAVLSPRVAAHMGGVVALTQHERDEAAALWARWGGDLRAWVIPNGVDPAPFVALPSREAARARFGLPDSARVVLFMGRLHPRKGADLLARAFQRANVPNAHLLLVGPDEGLRSTLDALAADDSRLHLTGYLDGAARLDALAAADVFALPAVGEGLPMSVLEAMACGLSVILSPDCHLPEVAAAGAGVEVVVDVGAIAEALTVLLTDSARRDAMGRAGRALVVERFTWDAVAAQLDAAYDELLAEVAVK